MKPASIFFALILIFSATAYGQEKPTRSECMAGFKLDWTRVTTDRPSVTSLWQRPMGTEAIEELAAFRISEDRSTLYLVFARNCGEKRAMSQRLIDYWTRGLREMPDFRWIDGTILPSPATLEFRGDSWRDG